MKTILILIVSMISVSAFSKEVKGYCQAEAETYVNSFEDTLTAFEGPFQGDDPTNDVSVKQKKVKSPDHATVYSEDYLITVNHQNEDGETWTQEYSVQMTAVIESKKPSCSMTGFSYLGSSSNDSTEE